STLQVHQDVFEHKNLQRRLVVWWEYVHGRNVVNRTLQRLLWALPPALGGKRGSVLQVQISRDFDGEQDDALGEIRGFMELLGPHIEQVLPRSVDDGATGETDAPATSTP
ncbi:MAG TPA: hypothetical protein VMY39_01330, partial [Planctomycetota bacterium]|nr:hypothetical protein [Planctomycetota bacterium]